MFEHEYIYIRRVKHGLRTPIIYYNNIYAGPYCTIQYNATENIVRLKSYLESNQDLYSYTRDGGKFIIRKII